MALKGHLQHFGLGELFQTLACNRHTGTLYVSSRTEKKTIYFSTGSIAFLASGDGTVRVGKILQREGRVSAEQIAAAVDEQETSDKQIGRILLEQGVISQADLQHALRKKFEEELYELLLWEEGDFEFVPDFCPPDLLEPMQRYTQVRVDPQSVIIEGLRQLDESRIIRARLPDPRVWIERQVSALPPGATLAPNEQGVWELCETSQPAGVIQEQAPDTRFRTLKILYRFVEEGWIRTLSFEDHLEIARRFRRHNDAEKAAELYRFLRDWGVEESQQAPFLDEVGRYLIELGRKKEGAQTLRYAFDRLRRDGKTTQAWEVGSVLRSVSPNDLELLQQLWPLRGGAAPRAVEAIRRELLTALKRDNRFHDAEALLAETEDIEGNQTSYWITRSEIARRLNQKDSSVEFLQRAEALAESQNSGREAIRIARMLYDIDPEIPGLKSKIQTLIEREAGAQRARKVRRIAAGVAAVTLLAIAIPSIRYEASARSLYEESIALREKEGSAADLEKARRNLGRIVDEYGLSTVAAKSRTDLGRIAAELKRRQEEERARIEQIEQKDRLDRASRRSEAERLLAASKEAVELGNFAEARAIIDRVLAGPIRSLPPETQRSILIPIGIETTPPGAEVWIDGQPKGATPVVHYFSPQSPEFSIRLERAGCEPRELRHSDNGTPKLSIQLSRAPMATGALLGGLDRPAVPIPGHIVVPCRDGRVYVLPGDSKVVKLASQVLAGGDPGHPSARVLVSGDTLVIAAFNGDLHCVNFQTWETEWTQRSDSPILAATVGPAGSVAIGDESGSIFLIDVGSGEELTRFEAGVPIDRLSLRGDVLIATDRTRRVRTFELPSFEVIVDSVVNEAIAGVLWDGSILLADGTRRSLEGTAHWPSPLTEVVDRDGVSVYGGDRQWVEIRDGSATAFPAPTGISCTPLPIGSVAYLGGTDGRIYCVDRRGDELWSLETESVPVDLLRTSDGTILALLRSGQLLLVEGNQP